MPALRAPQFASFRTRLIVWLLGLLLLVLGTIYVSVDRSTYDNTRAVIDDALQVGREVFDRLLAEREATFKVAFRALASDYAFRSSYIGAYREGDYPTILSMSNNLLGRTDNADMLMVVDYDFLLVADTLGLYPPESDFPWPALLEQADRSENYEASSFVLIEGLAYQVVAVPILLPLIEGWIVVGQRMDDAYLQAIRDIIGADVTLFLHAGEETGSSVASTLPAARSAALGEALAGAGEIRETAVIGLAGEEYVSLSRPLASAGGTELSALIQQSLPQALAPYRRLEERLIMLFALGVALSAALALLLGRSVTRPVLALAGRVRRIEAGDFSAGERSRRRDEIGQLENSVNQMARGLAEKEMVRDLLGKVVSREIAAELMQGGVKLGGETRTATILFSDIRDFTSLCEGRSPEDILSLLNRYLSEVSGAIEDHKGVVDKYIGDAVMALFGAPVAGFRDVENALDAALGMKAKVEGLNRRHRESGLPELNTGIGLHTGEVVAGNLGSANRLNYTVIGDAVNLASRLEALTKQYGVGIIVSEDTRMLGRGFVYRELDLVRVKGRETPVKIHELLGREGEVDAAILAEKEAFEEALALYRGRDWEAAAAAFRALRERRPEAGLYRLFLERLARCREKPPGEGWDGVFTFKSK